ncbi:MAG: 30S ribosomal protein S1, partial [Acidobacteriota bacterium]
MAHVLNPEQTESNPLNTELETPTLDNATEPQEPSTESTPNPEAAQAAEEAAHAEPLAELAAAAQIPQ